MCRQRWALGPQTLASFVAGAGWPGHRDRGVAPGSGAGTRPGAGAGAAQPQCPPSGIAWVCPPAQVRSQVESELQLTEQEPVQLTWQVAPPVQSTLPLAPTVRSQVEPPAQLALHDSPHAPLHSLPMLQSRLQLSPAQSLPPRSQACPAGHAQVEPVQSGGTVVAASLPQAERMKEKARTGTRRHECMALRYRRTRAGQGDAISRTWAPAPVPFMHEPPGRWGTAIRWEGAGRGRRCRA